MPSIASFQEIYNMDSDLDLIVDKIYEGGNAGNISDEVLSKLVNVGNSGGFRWRNTSNNKKKAYIVLYTTNEDLDWPDTLDRENGKFKYYGDNKRAGTLVSETSKKGNLILEEIFNENNRNNIPPILVFEKAITLNSRRSVRFLGLAVPEDYHLGKDESLKAIWRTSGDSRFTNYEAHFTILRAEKVRQAWLKALINDDIDKKLLYEPQEWKKYRERGLSQDIILIAPRTKEYRTKDEQLPNNDRDVEKLQIIYESFKDSPTKFEYFAAKLVEMMDPNFMGFDVTRPSRDGGIDALGEYKIGHSHSSIKLRCVIEAKCYEKDSGNGVSMLSRLISRLRHRDFGVFVTTSYVSQQAYEEIMEDEHPIIIISGKDIINILSNQHINRNEEIKQFIDNLSN